MKNIKLLGIYEDVVSIRSRLKISIMNIYLPEMIELCFELLEEYCLLSEEERRDATNSLMSNTSDLTCHHYLMDLW